MNLETSHASQNYNKYLSHFRCEHSLDKIHTVWGISHWNKFTCSLFVCGCILFKVLLIAIIYYFIHLFFGYLNMLTSFPSTIKCFFTKGCFLSMILHPSVIFGSAFLSGTPWHWLNAKTHHQGFHAAVDEREWN